MAARKEEEPSLWAWVGTKTPVSVTEARAKLRRNAFLSMATEKE
jgi:hypothetical protein